MPSIELRAYSAERLEHSHTFHQLVLPLRGELELEVGGRGTRATPRLAAMVAEGARHAFAATQSDRFLVVDLPHLEAEAFGLGAWVDAAARRVTFDLDRDSGALVHATAAQLERRPALRRSEAVVAGLLAALAAPTVGPAPSDRIRLALAFIDARAGTPIAVVDVARAVDLGASQLHALFRRELGTTPAAVLADVRLRRAEEMLVETRLPIADVALHCGYADQTSFTPRSPPAGAG